VYIDPKYMQWIGSSRLHAEGDGAASIVSSQAPSVKAPRRLSASIRKSRAYRRAPAILRG
jgi:hypothetical protein